MIDIIEKHGEGILKSFWETNLMLGLTLILCFLIAFPTGILLFSLRKSYLIKHSLAYQLLNLFLGTLRSVPFLIFIFILIPLNRLIFGTSFGTIAAILPSYFGFSQFVCTLCGTSFIKYTSSCCRSSSQSRG